jgi:hypothetical protein
MGRDNRNFNNRGRGGRNKHFQKRNQNQNNNWQTDKRLHENEVGITEFISDTQGFHGIIKCR